MRRFWTFCSLAVLVQCSASLKADGLIYQLPEDGTWVKFEGEFTSEDLANGGELKGKQSLTVSSVGRVVEEGVPCRWIEIKWEMGVEGHEQRKSVKKFLIPEKYLKQGETPIRHVVRAWHDDGNQSGAYTIPEDPYLWGIYWLDGPRKSKDVENDPVKSKLGQLKCTRSVATRQRKDATYEYRYTDSTWLHEKAPFGVVQYRQEMEAIRLGLTQSEKRTRMNLTLTDTGEDARTELPQYE